MSGQMVDGVIYEALRWNSPSGLSSPLLKTPTSQLAVNGGSQHPDQRKAGGHGPTLADEVEHLLPTPRVTTGGSMASLKQVDEVLAGNKSERGDCRLELTVEVLHYRQYGGRMSQPSDDGSKLWEDVPLPLPNQRDATEATDSAPASVSG